MHCLLFLLEEESCFSCLNDSICCRAIVELITYEDAGVVLQMSSDEEETDSDVVIESISDGE